MDPKKPVCSYGTSCFRKNPVHFQDLSHPHLEKIVSTMSGSEKMNLPDRLDFQCGDRALLQAQLQILRTIKNNENKKKTSGDTMEKMGESSIADKTDLKRTNSVEILSNSGSEKKPRAGGCNESERKEMGGGKSADDLAHDRAVRLRQAALQRMRQYNSEPEYVAPMGDFGLKWLLAAPYHMFFTAVPKERATWKQSFSVTMSEILDRSLGDIKESLHLNMLVDVGWLIAQYMIAGQAQKPKMTVFYNQMADDIELPENIQAHRVICPNYGTHHCKISIFQYKDLGIRIIVSSANLYKDDWEYRTQGLWVSPHLPSMDSSAKHTDGESPTNFKRDFISFLEKYDQRMKDWRAIVSRADCSSINVAFVASIPGRFSINNTQWGHQKLGSLLQEHANVPDYETNTTIVAQASSIGSLGPNYHSWIGNEIVASMAKNQGKKKTIPEFKFIFPTIENYKNSYDMMELSNCLCNSQYHKQGWIFHHMQKWKADKTSRTRAIPHIKTFTRMSEDNNKIWWFVLGSANLSKAAWGQRFRDKYQILSYEANVVFLPKFVTGENDFSITDDTSRSSPTFPIPYDLPLTPYMPNVDKPFVDDFFRDDFRN